MPLHPDARAFLDLRDSQGSIDNQFLSVADARAQSIRLNTAAPVQQVARVRDIKIPASQGEIPARLYYPTDADNLPILVFFRGGGFVIGTLDTSDEACRQWAHQSGCLVVSVDYRSAPDHKFPAAAEDAYQATRWVADHAAELGGDASRLAVGGMSAGGNLAAVTSLMARDKGTPDIKFQVLCVPVLDYNFDTPSYYANADGYGLTAGSMKWFWGHYLANPSDGANPYACPLRAADLSGLPPAFVMTAEYDPLHDEGAAYAEKLRAAGIPVEHRNYEGFIHGFLGSQAVVDMGQSVRRALNIQ